MRHARSRPGAAASSFSEAWGSGARLPPEVVDMEEIDPDKVSPPEWYEASPGRAEDVAFVFFAGAEDSPRANRITNRRWALCALGTASAAAMTSNDTVYCWTPIQHPTGSARVDRRGAHLGRPLGALEPLLGHDILGGGTALRRQHRLLHRLRVPRSRRCAARPGRTQPSGAPLRGQRHAGPLWKRLVERFGPVGVLELYASTEGNAILANLSGEKVGSVGRPIPGSAEVVVAAFDAARRELRNDASGFCVPAGRTRRDSSSPASTASAAPCRAGR